jgi:hypothetical protein
LVDVQGDLRTDLLMQRNTTFAVEVKQHAASVLPKSACHNSQF